MRPPARVLLPALAFLIAACSGGAPAGAPASNPPATSGGPFHVYAAVGASETVGLGTDDPTRQSFPQRLFQRLDHSSVLYNFGLPGELTAAALRDEVPPALAVHPTLVTVFLGVDDLAAGVAPDAYTAQLEELVAALRRQGQARVFLANLPQLDRLPAFLACQGAGPAGVACPVPGVVATAATLRATVSAFNAGVAGVAQRQGAVLVDLNAAGAVPDLHPEYVGRDGFHPSAAGAQAIADTFWAAMR